MRKRETDLDAAANHRQEEHQLQVLAAVTHDLRNLLGLVLGYGALLRDRLHAHDYAEALSIHEHVQRGAHHAHALVANYSAILQMTDHTLVLHMEPVELNRVLHDTIAVYETEARTRGITLTTCFADNLPPLRGDPVALERIFANLVHNALKFTPAGGMVTLRSAQHEGTLITTIADTGRGIASTQIPLLFAGGQLPHNGSPLNGTKLGLIIVKTFVDAHGGSVVVESAPGRGTAISVSLPLASGGRARM